MRRGEKAPPVYRASRVGMERTIPFKRPEVDSLLHEPCPVAGCGTRHVSDALPYSIGYVHEVPEGTVQDFWDFCSLGCVSRFAIVQELRS